MRTSLYALTYKGILSTRFAGAEDWPQPNQIGFDSLPGLRSKRCVNEIVCASVGETLYSKSK